jgi:hypothetical protein
MFVLNGDLESFEYGFDLGRVILHCEIVKIWGR